jgi:hypothetical protein
MKTRSLLILISTAVTCALFAGLLYLPLVGCDEPHCCPKLDADTIIYESIICQADCPGGGEIVAMGSFNFEKEDELCDPDDLEVLIYNITKGEELPPITPGKAKKGVYTFKQKIMLDEDTEFELRVVGDKECGVARQKFNVRVLRKGEDEWHHLIFTEQKSYPLKDLEWTRLIHFGPDIVVDRVGNANEFRIDVDHNVLHLQLMERGTPQNAYLADPQTKVGAGGYWTVKIPTESDYKKYSSLGKPPIKVDINVRCDCP